MRRTATSGRVIPAFFFDGLKALREEPVLAAVRGLLSAAHGKEIYLVGGAVRNLLLKRPVGFDYDFALKGLTAKTFSKRLADKIGGSSFLLDKKTSSYRVDALLKGARHTIDFAPVKNGSILADLKARDFTVDAAALSLEDCFRSDEPRLLDPRGGAADAEDRLLRMTSMRVFDADPLRCLRAIRISRQCGLRITPDTAALIKKKAALLKRVSVERIRVELQLIFAGPDTADALKSLYKLGIMDVIMPEISGWEDVRGYKLLSHAIKTVEEAEAFLSALRSGGIPWYPDELRAHFGLTSEERGTFQPNRAGFFKMAAFLHDIGKPLTISRREGRTIFWGHDHEGGRVVKDLMLRLRFSRRTALAMANLVKNHHRVFTLAALKEPGPKAKAHLFNAAGGASGVDLLCLSLVDARATRGGEDEGLLRLVIGMLGFYYQSYTKKRPKPLLNGSEIMKAFGVPEGRTVGEIINKISLGIEAGEVRNKKDAVIYVRRWLRDRDKGTG